MRFSHPRPLFPQRLIGVLMLILGVGLTSTAAAAQETVYPTAMEVAEALIAAFNAHDADTMADLVDPDLELFYFNEAGVAELGVRGREALREEMVRYFAALPNVQSRITERIDGPSFVAFREQIVGGQSSLAVYEVRGGLVARVWYYPAESTP